MSVIEAIAIPAGMKSCPQCALVIGRSRKACERGHRFAKGHPTKAKAAEPPKREWKKKAGKPAKKPGKNPAETPHGNATDSDEHFRVGIFNDGGLAILAARGSLELSPQEASELAGFCAQHFGDAA